VHCFLGWSANLRLSAADLCLYIVFFYVFVDVFWVLFEMGLMTSSLFLFKINKVFKRRGLTVDSRIRDRKVPGSISSFAMPDGEFLVWAHFTPRPFSGTRD